MSKCSAQCGWRRAGGAVLLEVILAMSIFFAAAAVIVSGMTACVRSARSLKTEARAANLAVTLLSEIQMGLVPADDDGPNEYDDDEDMQGWTWQIVTSDIQETVDIGSLKQVEIIITSPDGKYVYRLVQLMPAGDEEQPESEYVRRDSLRTSWSSQ